MALRTLLATAVLVAFSAPALAFHCPPDIKAIDAALPKAQLSAAQKADVKSLRNQGAAEHKAGEHKAAVGSLAKAMRIILNNM